MKKLPKRPRTFGRKKAKPYMQQKQTERSRRLSEKQINFYDWLSPGFEWYYKNSYDENGNYIGKKITGLLG